jgi:hypothetical protein
VKAAVEERSGVATEALLETVLEAVTDDNLDPLEHNEGAMARIPRPLLLPAKDPFFPSGPRGVIELCHDSLLWCVVSAAWWALRLVYHGRDEAVNDGSRGGGGSLSKGDGNGCPAWRPPLTRPGRESTTVAERKIGWVPAKTIARSPAFS